MVESAPAVSRPSPTPSSSAGSRRAFWLAPTSSWRLPRGDRRRRPGRVHRVLRGDPRHGLPTAWRRADVPTELDDDAAERAAFQRLAASRRSRFTSAPFARPRAKWYAPSGFARGTIQNVRTIEDRASRVTSERGRELLCPASTARRLLAVLLADDHRSSSLPLRPSSAPAAAAGLREGDRRNDAALLRPTEEQRARGARARGGAHRPATPGRDRGPGVARLSHAAAPGAGNAGRRRSADVEVRKARSGGRLTP